MRLTLHTIAVVCLLATAACASVALAPSQASNGNSFSLSSSATIITTSIRLRGNKLRRPESCRESLPRKSEDLPALVITGRVKEVYLAGVEGNASSPINQQQVAGQSNSDFSSTQMQQQQAATNNANNNKALVTIGRVIKGNQQLVNSDIIVSGFNSSSATPCPNYINPNGTWIMLLNHEGDRKYSIQGANLFSLNLNNLDRINAIVAEPYKRRGPIEDILCEAHYCAYGRCVTNERGQVSCQCPDSCPPLPAPVCGSDNTTYTNECHLIKEGCQRQRPLFVTKESSC